jgi:DNA-binding transcriptional LysR family regulator
VKGSLLANNGETVRRMTLAGTGLARMGDYHVRADIAAGRLVEVLADIIEPDEEEIHAVFLGGQRMPQRVRLFLDFIVPRLQNFLNASL